MAEKRRPTPRENEIYKHFKGSLYQIVTIAVHTETSDKLVIYKSVEKPERVFARPVDMFMSEVDHLRYPLVRAKYRFTLMVEAEETEDIEPETEVEAKEVEAKEADNVESGDNELSINPIVEAILDEKEYTKKIENFELLRGKCTKEMLTTIAISLDIQLNSDTVDEMYADILKTLKMHEKYESARLRV